MGKVELVFIPTPGAGHLVSTIEFSRRLIDRDARLSVTILVMSLPLGPPGPPKSSKPTDPAASYSSSQGTIRQVELPKIDFPPPDFSKEHPVKVVERCIAAQKPNVRNFIDSFGSPVAALIVDMFCSSMIELANELAIPSYTFFTSGAAFLGFLLHLPIHHERVGGLSESDQDLIFPSYKNPIPLKVLPAQLFNQASLLGLLDHGIRIRKANGIIVNTFSELEPYAFASFQAGEHPPVYPVGPVLDLSGNAHGGTDPEQHDKIMKWLDAQPESSVVFLCFGSGGSMGEAQVKEVALGLVNSGVRFLWAVRKPPAGGKLGKVTDYTAEELKEILPAEFHSAVEEEERGMICGWAPQVEVLAHDAISGFVSHCGWNSTLESLWFGRPIVTWPMYAEQQFNAFELVNELGLAVELRLDYNNDRGDVVAAGELEKAIKCLMEQDSDVRSRIKQVAEISRKTLMEGGSSFISIGRLIEDFVGK
ncbi:hypothetical protein Dimus_028059 [Dionaea muscipula]